jgi:hypothetical protein
MCAAGEAETPKSPLGSARHRARRGRKAARTIEKAHLVDDEVTPEIIALPIALVHALFAAEEGIHLSALSIRFLATLLPVSEPISIAPMLSPSDHRPSYNVGC